VDLMGFSYVPITDVSRHQGAISFATMAARGVKGVIIRLGNGRKRDDRAAQYWPAAKAAGLAVSGYWFCNPKVDASGSTQMARMTTFHAELAALYGAADFPLMMDVESYTLEPNGGYPALRGDAYEDWLADGAGTLTRADKFGRRPIVYTNAAYYGSMGMQAGALRDCPLIVARYPFYFEGAPPPPADPDLWDDWILLATSKRPQAPVGWSDWDGWQFAAGFDRVGPYYGVSSADLDLNIIRPESWAEWTGQSPVDSHPDRVAPPLPVPDPQEDDMPVFTHSDNDHEGHPPRWTFWYLMPNGTKRWIDEIELDGIRGVRTTAPGIPMAQVDSRPNYVEPSAAPAPPTATPTPRFNITLSGVAEAG
jgi:GH25 family lysozyme M1 (1,4-beta-N-acetylmuramidase)